MEKEKFLDLLRHLPRAAFVAIVALLTAAFAGVYNIGADAPHYRPVFMALEQLRDRAIKHHASEIVVPADLNSPARIATGGMKPIEAMHPDMASPAPAKEAPASDGHLHTH